MAKYIKPKLTFSSSSEAAAADPGPFSMALSLTTTPNADASGRIAVDTVKMRIINPTTTDSRLFDGSTFDDGGVAGSDGGFLYLKNVSAADHDIYFGVIADGGAVTDTEAADDPDRFMTLKQGEFAFLPWDYTMDITCDAEDNAATLEYWVFNRSL